MLKQIWRITQMAVLSAISVAWVDRRPAQAGIIVGNLGNNQDASLGYAPVQVLAQQFRTDNQTYILGDVIARVGSFSPNNASIAELVTDAGGLPSNAVLTTLTYTTIPIGGFANVPFSPVETQVLLAPNTDYWFVLNGTEVGQGALWAETFSIAHDGPGSILKRAANVESRGWFDISGGFPPFMLQVNGIIVPEPQSWVMFAIGATVVLACRNRLTQGFRK